MSKNTKKFITFLFLITFALLVLTPYFTSPAAPTVQEKESEANYQRILKEKEAKKDAEKIAEEKIYLTGKFDPAKRDDFILIPSQYTLSENKMYLRKETYAAFLDMQNAANVDKIDLIIASATRNFDYQKNLWNNKWTGVTIVGGQNLSISIPDGLTRFIKILEYSAVPGTSRHHWGTDIDINGATPEYFDTIAGKKVYDWLIKNGPMFGFCQTYNPKDPGRPTGYNEEKWHWSYMPLSRDFIQEYKKLIKDEDIKGFLGDEFVPGQDLINNYVLSINPDCI